MHMASTGTDPLRPQTKKALAQKGHKPERHLTKRPQTKEALGQKRPHTKMSNTRRTCLQNVYLYAGFGFL